MSAVAAHAYGFSSAETLRWIRSERLEESLSSGERAFLGGAIEHLFACQMQVDAVYTLAWCTSVIEEFSANEQMPDDLVNRLPDFLAQEPSAAFRAKLTLRPLKDMLVALDAAYCFHWAWRDAYLSGKRLRTNNLSSAAERRKALEWIVTSDDWDSVSLDT